jgi:hypothetical protein
MFSLSKGRVEGTVKFVYLSSPYSHQTEQIRNYRFEQACKATALLLRAQPDWNVFSPIAHSHPLHVHGGLAGNWDFWSKVDYDYIDRCDIVVVLALPGWKESTGVTEELVYANQHGKHVIFMVPNSDGTYKMLTDTWSIYEFNTGLGNPS